jgi:hypothetical protein
MLVSCCGCAGLAPSAAGTNYTSRKTV